MCASEVRVGYRRRSDQYPVASTHTYESYVRAAPTGAPKAVDIISQFIWFTSAPELKLGEELRVAIVTFTPNFTANATCLASTGAGGSCLLF
jgi:hypothetical protein